MGAKAAPSPSDVTTQLAFMGEYVGLLGRRRRRAALRPWDTWISSHFSSNKRFALRKILANTGGEHVESIEARIKSVRMVER